MNVRRYLGLVWAVAAAVAWIVLAARTPTSTFHFAPMVVAAAWVIYDGYSEGGVTPHRAVNDALAGLFVAAAATTLLELRGDLLGPVFWPHGPDSPVVAEHLMFAAGGAILGLAASLRRANRTPATRSFTRR